MKSHLADDEGEHEVDERGDALPGAARLQGLHLRGVQPAQGAPGPGVRADVDAHDGQHKPGRPDLGARDGQGDADDRLQRSLGTSEPPPLRCKA